MLMLIHLKILRNKEVIQILSLSFDSGSGSG